MFVAVAPALTRKDKMIYSDPQAAWDVDYCPADRKKELCVNCGNYYSSHNGWACNYHATGRFSELDEDKRYLTNSMIVSLIPNQTDDFAVIVEPAPITVKSLETHQPESWKAWSHNVPGDCGIRKEMCDYHK